MNSGDPLKRVALARSAPLLSRTGLARKPARSRAKRTKAPDWTTDVRETVARRSRGVCELRLTDCTGQATDMHHRLRRREGNHTAVNALHCCRRCHQDAHASPKIARVAGWIVPSWDDPATVPVRIRSREVWLTDDGKYVGPEQP